MRFLPALLALAAPLSGQEQPRLVTDDDRWRLFTGCRPLSVTAAVSEHAVEVGFSEERLREILETRLRGPRLYDPGEDPPLLGVTVDTVKRQLALAKLVRDDATGLEREAVTWESLDYGTATLEPDFIMWRLSRVLDYFILEYLRVNDCPP